MALNCSDVPLQGIQVIPRTCLGSKVPVAGHVAPAPVVHPVSLAIRPYQPLDAVSLANIRQQVDKGGQGLLCHLIGTHRLAGHLDRDGPVVILSVGTAPGPVPLLHAQADAAVLPYSIVAGRTIIRVVACEVGHVQDLPGSSLPGSAVYGNSINGVVPGAGPVGGQPGASHQRAVTHWSRRRPQCRRSPHRPRCPRRRSAPSPIPHGQAERWGRDRRWPPSDRSCPDSRPRSTGA